MYIYTVYSDETDVTFKEDGAIVRRFSCHVNMGTEDEAASQLFDRDESSTSPRRAVMNKANASSSPNDYWTTEPSEGVKLRVEEKGAASEPPFTIIDMFRKTVDKFGSTQAINVKKTDIWHHWTYEKYFDNCQTLAKAFIEVMHPSMLKLLSYNSCNTWLLLIILVVCTGPLSILV